MRVNYIKIREKNKKTGNKLVLDTSTQRKTLVVQ